VGSHDLSVEIDGLRLAYERAGDGPPLLLLHGYIGDGRSTFSRQLDELSDEFTVVAWDAPGAGRSSDPPESFALRDYADSLAGFIAALDLSRPHVVGLSFGGALALELYARHPAIPRSLVLAGASAGWAGSLPLAVVNHRRRQAEELAALPADELVRALLPTMFSEAAPRESIARFAASVGRFHPLGLRTMARAYADADLRDVLPSIDVPTLLLHGDLDARIPLDVAKALRGAITSSEVVVMRGVGHVSSIEAADQFNAEVRKFLRSAAS
jgi:pimeloyl-ACP methyl ester carboxylesterase